MDKLLLDFPVLITGSGTILGAGLPDLLTPYFQAHKVHTADMHKINSPQSTSKLFLNLPDFYQSADRSASEKAYIYKLLDYVKENKIRLIIPASGFDLKLLAATAHMFEELGCIIFVETLATINTFFDKYKTIEALKAHGLPTLQTWLMDLSFNFDIGCFPLIIKPRFGYGSKGIYIVRSKKKLKSLFESGVFSKIPYIAQEYIGPPNEEYSCSIVYHKNGSPLSIMAILRTSVERITLEAKYNTHCHLFERKILEFADILGGSYCLNLQFVVRDEVPFIFEINPRFGTAEPFRVLFGQNAFHLLLNEHFTPHQIVLPLRRYGLAQRNGTHVFLQNS